MIIDLKLPDMNGHELLRTMAAEEIRAFPPVIVYTWPGNRPDYSQAAHLRYSFSGMADE